MKNELPLNCPACGKKAKKPDIFGHTWCSNWRCSNSDVRLSVTVWNKAVRRALRKQNLARETPEQTKKRLARNRKARAQHWLNTGVSPSGIQSLKDKGML